MITLKFESCVSSTRDTVWQWITSVEGISRELRPIVKMTFPSHIHTLSDITIEPKKRLFRSVILLGSILPIDYSDLTLVSMEAGRGFVEESPMLSMRRWQHVRTLETNPHGTVITDVLTFEPRVKLLSPLFKWFIWRLFTHRHNTLRTAL